MVGSISVSNLFPLNTGDRPDTPLTPGTVWPRSWAKRLAEDRVHGIEITAEILRLFVPEMEKVDQAEDKGLHDLAGIIAETMSIHAAATDLMAQEPWDLAAVYYSGIDHFSHRFMRHHARRKADAGRVYAAVVENAYRYHDLMLGRLMALTGPDCTVMVLSDHGFHSDRLLPDYIPAEAAGPAVEHRDFGIFSMAGPGVLEGERIYGANVMDIAPTVLHMFGLPAGRDMDGRVLINAFRDQRRPEAVASWEEIAGDDGRHPPARQYDGAASAEALKQLIGLGYIAPIEQNIRKAIDDCVADSRYNLARSHLGAGQAVEAAEILESLLESDPDQARYYRHLFQCRLQQRDAEAAAAVLDRFDAACARFAGPAHEELERRRAERPDNDLSRRSDSPESAEVYRRRDLAEKASGYQWERLFLRTRLAVFRAPLPGGKEQARALLEQLASAAGRRSEPALFLAEGFAAVDEDERALEYARRARRADPDQWQAMGLEARIHYAAGHHQAAVERAVESLALVYFQPFLHYLLGISLRHLGEDARSEQEFRVALAQMPGLAPAHDELAALLRRDPARIGEASLHMARAEVLREEGARRERGRTVVRPAAVSVAGEELRGFERWSGPPQDRTRLVTIVSGLPRSGTSMMMQMLAAGGMEPYSDGKRMPDSDNPRGYFEHEQAARLHQDASWVPSARGKAVKIVAHLLPYLPDGEEYRVVFMLRNLEEVVASQSAMLERLERAGAALDARELARVYTRQLVRVESWLRTHTAIAVMPVDYTGAVADASGTAARLADFLGEPFDREAAATAVDGDLRRQRC